MFAEIILAILNMRGISQKELAMETGIASSDISRFISGEREPKHSQLLRMSEVLNVNPSSFFPGYEHFALRDRCSECVGFRLERNTYNLQNAVIQFIHEDVHIQQLIFSVFFYDDHTENTLFKLISEMYQKVFNVVWVVSGQMEIQLEGASIIKSAESMYVFTGPEKRVFFRNGTHVRVTVTGRGYGLIKEVIIERSRYINVEKERVNKSELVRALYGT